MIALVCSKCQRPFKVSDFLAGFTVICPACKGRVDVPKDGEGPAASTPSDTPSGRHSSAEVIPADARFRLVGLHAMGGLGLVSLAHDEALNRDVAFKEIQVEHADNAETRSRFLAEAEITGRLEHPGIVPVYASGHYADGRPFYAMRFIKGDSLKDAIARHHGFASGGSTQSRDRAWELRSLLGRFVTVCRTIQYAHDRGVLHRDIKPSNVMLGKYGETLIVDWGIAKVIGRTAEQRMAHPDEATLRPSSTSATPETAAGSAMGTPQYMSPEQAAGAVDDLSPASDVYSLGATLYSILTGESPLPSMELPVMLQKVRTGDIPRPGLHKPNVDPVLEAICLKAMALKAADRYESAEALAEDVELWLADKPVSAWPDPWKVRARRWMAAHRTLMTGAAAALLVGVVSLAITVVLLGSKNDELSKVNGDLVDANKREKDATKKVQTTAEKLALTNIDLEKAVKEEGIARQDAADKARIAIEKEKIAIKNELEANKQRENAVEQTKRAKDALALSQMQNYAAQLSLAQQEWDAHRGPEARFYLAKTLPQFRGWEFSYLENLLLEPSQRSLSNEGFQITALELSADGRWLATGASNGNVKLLDLTKKQPGPAVERLPRDVTAMALSPDGKWLAFTSYDGLVRLFSLESRKQVVLDGHKGPVFSLAFSADSKHLASGSVDKTVRVWEVGKPKDAVVLTGPTTGIRDIAFHRDGRMLVGTSHNNTVSIWSLDKRADPLVLRADTFHGFSLNPIGKLLATASPDEAGTIQLWDLGDPKKPQELKRDTSTVGRMAFSRDGRRLAVVHGKSIRVWDPQTARVTHVLKGHSMRVHHFSISPDGNRLASTSADRTVRVWDLESDQDPIVLKKHQSTGGHVAFSTDGKNLFSVDQSNVLAWEVNKEHGPIVLGEHGTSGPIDAVFGPSRTQLATIASGLIRLWDLQEKSPPMLLGSGNGLSATFDPDGSWLAAGCSDNAIRLWDLKNLKKVRVLKGLTQAVSLVAYSPDGKWLASASIDNSVRLWDLANTDKPIVLDGHTERIEALRFSPNGRWLASSSWDKTVRVWDLKNGVKLTVLNQHTGIVRGLVFSPDGDKLASASNDETVRVWNLVGNQPPVVLKNHTDGVFSVAFSPDGKTLASGSYRTIRLWRLARPTEPMVLEGHSLNVIGLEFTRDGTRLASGSYDSTVRIWDVAKGVEVLTLRGHTDRIRSISFSRDGCRLVSASQDGTVRIWDAPGAK